MGFGLIVDRCGGGWALVLIKFRFVSGVGLKLDVG